LYFRVNPLTMLKPEIRKVVILGAGRLAVNFSMAVRKKGYEIVEVYNRTPAKGIVLARKLKASYISEPEMITPFADLYLVVISDAAIPQILKRLKIGNKLIVHTSGSVGMEVLEDVSPNIGVIYPPQTFTAGRLLSFRTVPLCIEANSGVNLQRIRTFAETLSKKVYVINSDQRKVLHLSAVFASNFTNFMIAVSQQLLLENGLDFGILGPIIRQTAANAASGDVFGKQTGPAIREDRETLRKHRKLLENHPGYQEIYDIITRHIIKRKNES
jgi:predicted short-subunit dehydrogenase-like oxidoreductase (DUF2520 family)